MQEPLSPQELIYRAPRKPAPGRSPAHQKLVGRLHKGLDEYVTPRKLGRLLTAPVGVVLDRREGIVLQPDIIFVIDGRESIISEHVWGPPDMVLEITSQLTHSGKLEERVAWFSVYGVREYWLVQPEQRGIAILELAHGGVRRRTLFDHKTLIKTPLFADFDKALSELLSI